MDARLYNARELAEQTGLSEGYWRQVLNTPGGPGRDVSRPDNTNRKYRRKAALLHEALEYLPR